jgi:tripartite-type tricarboxylate transporter receptor subunit TctC
LAGKHPGDGYHPKIAVQPRRRTMAKPKRTVRTRLQLLTSLTLTLAAFFLIATPLIAADPDYPKRPITMVVPFSAGGSTDVQARLVAAYWKEFLGQPIAVENKPGGGGAIGLREVLLAKPDGYTMGCGMFPDSIIQVALKGSDAGFKNEDMLLLGSFSDNPGALMVMANGPFKTLQDFIQYAKANPNKLTVSISSPTWMLHLIDIEDKYGITINPIMFKGGAEQVNALLGGHVMASMGGSHFAIQGKDKGILALAVSSKKRLEGLPSAPTFIELGQDIAYDVRRFFFVPVSTPKSVTEKLSATLAKVGGKSDFPEKVRATGEEYAPLGSAEFDRYYKEMIPKITEKVKRNEQRFSE